MGPKGLIASHEASAYCTYALVKQDAGIAKQGNRVEKRAYYNSVYGPLHIVFIMY